MHGSVYNQTAVSSAVTVRTYEFTDGRGAVARPITYTLGGWITTDIEYDAMGRPYRTSNPYSGYGAATPINPDNLWTTSEHDGLNRVFRTTLADGNVVETQYDGRVTTVFDPAGKSRRSVVDGLGRVERLDEPDSSGNLGAVVSPVQPTFYTYSAIDNLVRIEQGGQQRFFKYDSLGRMTHERHVEMDAPHTQADPLTPNTQWSRRIVYNTHDLVTDAYDARGVHTHFEYDGLNRATQITYSDATLAATYTYDETRAGYFNRGRLTTAATASTADAPATSQAYDYDLMGRIANHRQTISSTTYTMAYGYNLIGQLTTETYQSGRMVTNTYMEGARLMNVADETRNYVMAMTYKPHGGLQSEMWANGAEHTVSYNARLQASERRLTVGATEVQRYTYSYGATDMATGAVDAQKNTGQIGRIESFVGGQKQWDQRHKYDELGRLDLAAEHLGTGALNYRSDFDYDRYGNRYRPLQGTQNPNLYYTPVETSDISPTTNRFTTPAHTPVAIGATHTN